MKWEYQLMRDMLERATLYLSVPTLENHKTGAMLRQAATVMNHWNRKIIDMEIEAQKSNEAVAEIERLNTELACYRKRLREKNNEILEGNTDMYCAFSVINELRSIAENESQLSDSTKDTIKHLESRWYNIS